MILTHLLAPELTWTGYKQLELGLQSLTTGAWFPDSPFTIHEPGQLT